MEENIIELNGKKIDLSKLSDEQLVKLHKQIAQKEKDYKKRIEEYQKKYPFLKDIK